MLKSITLVVEIPQLDILTATLTRLGDQLMANFDMMNQSLDHMADVIQQELTEIQAILNAPDTETQQKIDAATARIDAFSAQIEQFVTPPPAPNP